MIKASLVISALLLSSASIANAATAPAAPATQGAASVQANLDANKSDGNAVKGLTNAEAHITAEHGKALGHEEKSESRQERSEKPNTWRAMNV